MITVPPCIVNLLPNVPKVELYAPWANVPPLRMVPPEYEFAPPLVRLNCPEPLFTKVPVPLTALLSDVYPLGMLKATVSVMLKILFVEVFALLTFLHSFLLFHCLNYCQTCRLRIRYFPYIL